MNILALLTRSVFALVFFALSMSMIQVWKLGEDLRNRLNLKEFLLH
ncbi:hypothetical protein [Spirosoma terrae]|uniref:Uncharacterized protein n=1 Tax=Spirosoma terrae TaxID=1968276 RepID=A0A6L9L384_9BACT|nr:hypothetical protein [Spirosoma terrae]NDU94954.1 hypothetical protein [Spirosoma terrae]